MSKEPREHARTYLRQRLAENRAACTECGTSDKVCTERVVGLRDTDQGRVDACCSTCMQGDTHPKQEVAPTFQVAKVAVAKPRRQRKASRNGPVTEDQVNPGVMRLARELLRPGQRIVVESRNSVVIVDDRNQ